MAKFQLQIISGMLGTSTLSLSVQTCSLARQVSTRPETYCMLAVSYQLAKRGQQDTNSGDGSCIIVNFKKSQDRQNSLASVVVAETVKTCCDVIHLTSC